VTTAGIAVVGARHEGADVAGFFATGLRLIAESVSSIPFIVLMRERWVAAFEGDAFGGEPEGSVDAPSSCPSPPLTFGAAASSACSRRFSSSRSSVASASCLRSSSRSFVTSVNCTSIARSCCILCARSFCARASRRATSVFSPAEGAPEPDCFAGDAGGFAHNWKAALCTRRWNLPTVR
jgi:hypothetical protein